MTVKQFTDEEKATIGRQYQNKTVNQKQLAAIWSTSERTINRVLNELGLLTAVPRLKGEAHQALITLAYWGIKPSQLQKFLEELEDAGMLVTEDGNITAIVKPAPSRQQIIAEAVKMEEGTWAALLTEIVTARVAVQHNKHVQTVMLNLQQKVDETTRKNKKD